MTRCARNIEGVYASKQETALKRVLGPFMGDWVAAPKKAPLPAKPVSVANQTTFTRKAIDKAYRFAIGLIFVTARSANPRRAYGVQEHFDDAR